MWLNHLWYHIPIWLYLLFRHHSGPGTFHISLVWFKSSTEGIRLTCWIWNLVQNLGLLLSICFSQQKPFCPVCRALWLSHLLILRLIWHSAGADASDCCYLCNWWLEKTICRKTEAFGSRLQIQWFCFPIIGKWSHSQFCFVWSMGLLFWSSLMLIVLFCHYLHVTSLLLSFSRQTVILMQSQWLCSWVSIQQGKQHSLSTCWRQPTQVWCFIL